MNRPSFGVIEYSISYASDYLQPCACTEKLTFCKVTNFEMFGVLCPLMLFQTSVIHSFLLYLNLFFGMLCRGGHCSEHSCTSM